MAGRGGLAVFLMWALLRIRYVMSSYGPVLCGQVDPFPPFALGTASYWHLHVANPQCSKGSFTGAVTGERPEESCALRRPGEVRRGD